MAVDDASEVAKWDPRATKRLIDIVRPIGKRWFRWEVRGLERFPPAGGALVISRKPRSTNSPANADFQFWADYDHQRHDVTAAA